MNDVTRLLANAKRAIGKAKTEAARRTAEGCTEPAEGRRRGRLVRAVNHLTDLIEATGQIIVQTRQRLAGTMPAAASRRVSLHDPDAHPIAKGRLGKPVEFGYQAQECDNVDGIVLDHDVQPATRRMQPAGCVPPWTRHRAGQEAHRESPPDRNRGSRLR